MKKLGTILVGNLVSETDEAIISGLFVEAGAKVIAVDMPVDHRSGKSRGYAFVQMASQMEAEEAIAKLDGVEISGRRINMSLVEPEAAERKGRWYLLGF
ncbi:MAG TPA: RNA-binding protein [Candidatus Obscuribacterales bacterium]